MIPQKKKETKKERGVLTTAKSDVRVGVGLFGHAGDPKVGVGAAAEPDGRGARSGGEAHHLLVAEGGKCGRVKGDRCGEVCLGDLDADVVDGHVEDGGLIVWIWKCT